MNKIKLNGLEEEIYYEKLSNGLDVYLYSKEGITNNYVTFTTKFGSIYNEFVPIGENQLIKVPHGVAHFLEHLFFKGTTNHKRGEFEKAIDIYNQRDRRFGGSERQNHLFRKFKVQRLV